jgi:sulfatase modifying factor 1
MTKKIKSPVIPLLAILALLLPGCASRQAVGAGAGVGSTYVQPQEAKAEDMIYVEGGTFTMADLAGSSGDAISTHPVTISSFYMGKYEVTQQLWQDVMGSNPSFFSGDNLPVEQINWYECIEFCNALSQAAGLKPVYMIDKENQDGFNTNPEDVFKWTVSADWTADGYRLPTNAEWEYAARGGKNHSPYQYSGSDSMDDVGWYFENSGDHTHPVGMKKPNILGLYDMTGNVSEWCWNWYAESLTGDARTDPRGNVSGDSRVLRGSCYNINAGKYSRIDCCDGDYPQNGKRIYGLRVVRAAK